MATFATVPETTEFSKAPIGQFQAVCCQLLHLGYKEKSFKNPQGVEEKRNVNEYRYIFQLNKLDDKGKRFEIASKPMNLSLHEKSDLRKFLVQARGHDLTEVELKPPGLDIECLVGQNFLISVTHNEASGKTYANIASIMPPMEGLPPIMPLDFVPRKPKQESDQPTGMPPPQVDGVGANANDVIPF